MKCPSCGSDIEPGTAFCGNCGTRLTPSGSAAGMPASVPGPVPSGSADTGGPPPQPRSQIYTGSAGGGGLMATLREKPMLGAAVIGGAALLLVLAVIVFGGGSDSKSGSSTSSSSSGPDIPAGLQANGAVLLTPQGTATPTDTPVPSPTATPVVEAATATPQPPAPTPQPQQPQVQPTVAPPPPPPPTPTPQPPPPPTPTPQPPPPPTPTPQPQAQTASVPASKTSKLVSITIAGVQNSTARQGTTVQLCWSVAEANQYFRISIVGGDSFRNGVSSGPNVTDCDGAYRVPGPPGILTLRIDDLGTDNKTVLDYATVSLRVTP